MNVIEAAKAAGFRTGQIHLTEGDLIPFATAISATDCIHELERFSQIIRNQALEDAAVLCDEKSNAHDIQGKTFILKDLVDCAHAIRSMKKEQTNG